MLRLFKLFGVPVNAHWTFALLCWFIGTSLGVVPTFLLVASILAHEFGHILVARHYGYRTQSVTAMGLGMMAHIMGDMRRGEKSIVFAGPAVNFVLAGLIWGTLQGLHYALTEHWFALDHATTVAIFGTMGIVMWGNLVLGIFNLMPLFPLDGGRLLRAIVGKWTTRLKATKIAAWTGTVIAIGLAPYVLARGDIFLMFILPMAVFMSWKEVKRLELTGVDGGLM